MIHKLTRTLALAVATTTAAAPAASAMLPPPDTSGSAVASAPQAAPHGFDFGDAAIGAGTAVVVLLVGGGGTLAVHRGRRPLDATP
jgi:hypothetical protein